MTELEREELIDRLVAEYADRAAGDAPRRREEVLARHPDVAEELERCFRMIDVDAGGDPPILPVLPEGVELGDFRIVREIGRGGMGVVYEAEQKGVGRRVALKVLRNHLTLDVRHVARFRREAKAVGRLDHPNVVRVHYVGEERGHHYMAMELIEGPSLATVISALSDLGRPPTAEDLARVARRPDLARCEGYAQAAVTLLLPVFAGVQAAHDAGLMHRDIKPSNILLDAAGKPYVVDFGLARGEGEIGLSLTGEPVGTPFYMSPEQARAAADKVDTRTDVYSLGITLYEMLALRVPFQGESVIDVIRKILQTQPRRLRTFTRDVSTPLEAVIHKAIDKDPGRRYASAREFGEDIESAVRGGPVRAPRSTAWRSFLACLSGTGGEYRSEAEYFGYPLVHVAFGMDPETRTKRVARGWIAVGDVATGGIALGGAATGIVAFGGISFGIIGVGGMTAGAIAIGGLAAGLVAIGGFALGLASIGGFTIGYYSSGGFPMGAHVLSGNARDAAAFDFFEMWFPWWLDFTGIK